MGLFDEMLRGGVETENPNGNGDVMGVCRIRVGIVSQTTRVVSLAVVEALAVVASLLRRIEKLDVAGLSRKFREAGYLGTPNNPGDQPLLSYLRENGANVQCLATSGVVVGLPDGEVVVVGLPENAASFNMAFNAGRVPEVIREQLRSQYTSPDSPPVAESPKQLTRAASRRSRKKPVAEK